jgi:hypothetical protein
MDVVSQITCNTSGGFCLAGKDIGNAAWGMRVIFKTVGLLIPLPWVLSVTSRAFRQNLLLKFLIQLYRAVLLFPSFTFENGSVGFFVRLIDGFLADARVSAGPDT